MTPDRLRKELIRSMKRRGLDVPEKPYHAERLYPHSGEFIPPEIDQLETEKKPPWRRTACEACGKPLRTRQPEDKVAFCRPCWLRTVRAA